MKKIKLLLFDIDNTLVFGAKAEVYYKQYSLTLEKALAQSLNIDIAQATEIANYHRLKYHGRGEKAFETYNLDMAIWHESIRTIDTKMLEPMASVQKLLTSLKNDGYILGAITDSPVLQAEKILKRVGIDKNIFTTFIGWENGRPMPKGGSSEIYKKLLLEYKINPNEAFMIGDSLETDIIPADSCGMKVLHISQTNKSGYPTIDSVELLPSYLKQYEKTKQ